MANIGQFVLINLNPGGFMTVKTGIDSSMPNINFTDYDLLPSGVVVTDKEMRVVFVNKKFSDLSEISLRNAFGKPIWECFNEVERSEKEKIFSEFLANFKDRAVFQSFWLRPSDSQPLTLLWEIVSLKTADGFQGFIACSTNISEYNQQINEKLTDHITGLPSFAVLESKLESLIVKYRADHSEFFSLMVVDIDRYKLHCHENNHIPEFGEIILKEVAQRLIKLLGPGSNEFVYRLGDDRFFVLVGYCEDTNEVEELAESVRSNLSLPFLIQDSKVEMTVSIGASFPYDTIVNATALFREANYSLLAAKTGKKNKVVIFNSEMQKKLENSIKTEVVLREALANPDSWFVAHFQPIARMDNGEIYSFEALVRKRKALGSQELVYPGEFITIAEQNNLIDEIDRWMMRQAVRKLSDISHEFPDTYISLNLSAQYFDNNDVDVDILALQEEFGIDITKLKIEITETMFIKDPDRVLDQLRRLNKIGVKVDMDDFGTGNHGFQALKGLMFNLIKTDMSMLDDVLEDPTKLQFFVATMIFFREIKKNVINEGVETQEELIQMLKVGSQLVQGYVFSKPVPENQVLDMLRNQPFKRIVAQARSKMFG